MARTLGLPPLAPGAGARSERPGVVGLLLRAKEVDSATLPGDAPLLFAERRGDLWSPIRECSVYWGLALSS